MALSPQAIKPWLSGLQTPSLHPQTGIPSSKLQKNLFSFQQHKKPPGMSSKRLTQMAKKWRRMAALGRKRLTSSLTPAREAKEGPCGTPTVAGKGHCAVYTTDGMRFEVPLAFLGTAVFGELLRMSQEEFGFAGSDDGRIMLPCDAMVMEYAMCLLRRNASAEMETALLSTMAMVQCRYDVASHLGFSQHVAIISS